MQQNEEKSFKNKKQKDGIIQNHLFVWGQW
jgi:hypothetical protein